MEAFNLACLRLLTRRTTKASVNEIGFQRIYGRGYSRAICLASQQVLIVETMLGHAEYSDRAYFPRYRECLKITGGNRHENPLGTAFSRKSGAF